MAWRWRRTTMAVVAATLLALVVGGGATWLWYLNGRISGVERIDLDLDTRTPALDQAEPVGDGEAASGGSASPVTILVAGVDAGASRGIAESMREGEWEPGSYRSDTIMVVRLSADRERAYVVSVPRDSWVEIPGHGRRKVNAAFSLGGPALYLETVEKMTGMQMDHLAILDWNGFKDLTTAIGGVEVYIPEDVRDPSQGIRWEQGRHLLEGTPALQYVRQRHGLPSGDLDRIQRQQNFIRATMRKLLADGTMRNPVKLTNVLEAVTENLLVDDSLTDARIRELALSARGLGEDDVRFLTIPTNGLDRIRGRSVVRVDLENTRALFDAMAEQEVSAFLAEHEVDRLPGARSVD